MYRVTLDNGKCLGCLTCLRCENFQCGEDFKARVVTAVVKEPGCSRDAAENCPVDAIEVAPLV